MRICLYPDVDMLIGNTPPKFDIFDGTGDPHAHLRAYCDKLGRVGRNGKLRMKLFIRSLTGETLTWYTRHDPRNWREWKDMAEDFMNRFRFNTKITPDRFTLVKLQKKLFESFQEYARRWRLEATIAQPHLDDSELRAQEGIYFEKMMGMMGQKFPELVQKGDFLEEGIKFGKVQSMAALQAVSKAIQSGSISSGKKKKEELKNEIESLIKSGAIQCTPASPNVNRNLLPNHQNQGANMVTLDEEYDLKGTIVTIGNTKAARVPPRRTSMITSQLKHMVMVQTYQQLSTTGMKRMGNTR
nr:uncharacterized protein LOC104084833 [Nicotiana tomentosiformis]